MHIGFRIDRRCPVLGILAVGVFAFGITHQDAPKGETDSNKTGVSKVPASPVKPRGITAGLRIQAANVPVAPPVRAYRTRTVAFEGRPDLPLLSAERMDEQFSGIAAPYTGVGPGCELDIQCDDCDPCTKDRCIAGDCVFPPAPEGTPCDDGLFCNGIEVCNGVGVCDQAQERPCANRPGFICDEEARPGLCVLPCQDNSNCDDGLWCTGVESCVEKRCIGGGDAGDLCTDGSGCDSGLCGGLCRSGGSPCGEGATCNETAHSCGNGRCCTGTGYVDCSRETLAACSGTWLGVGGDDATCEDLAPPPAPNAGEDFDCPRYESGIVQGDLIMHVGPVGLAECYTFQEIGDDYELDIAAAYLEVTTFRFIGGFEAGTGSRMRITFYDSQGHLVEDTITEPSFAPGNLLRTVVFNEPPTIPSQGFVALRPAVESPNGLDYWMSTDTVGVGYNDVNVMWLNGSPSPNILTPDPGILAFEIVVEEQEASLGACCDVQTGICEQKPPRVCEDEGGLFQGIGKPCAVCTNDPLGPDCKTAAECLFCAGGGRDGEPCDPNPRACPGGTCVSAFCYGGERDGEACDCPDGACTDQGDCVVVPPACTVTASCCDPVTGECIEVTSGLCSGSGAPCLSDLECPSGETCDPPCPIGTVPHSFGTWCDPNCCEQPIYEGYDTCAEASTHVINVPFPGMDPVTLTLTGDNKQATFGDYESGTCDLQIFNPDGGTRDRGWWHAFAIDDCAFVRIDTCCTQEMTGEILEPQWAFLMTDCDPCTTAIAPKAVFPPVGTGTSAYARGAPFCNGDDMWQTYGPLPPGTYYYPIHTAPGGHSGQYQLHITVGACDVAACCLEGGVCKTGTPHAGLECDGDAACGNSPPGDGDCVGDCDILNQPDCEELGGYWLGIGNIPPDDFPIVVCELYDFHACAAGSCCTGPGECVDEGLVGEPLNLQLCQAVFGGTYVGGALCDWPKGPCPVCEIETETNCQSLSESSSRVVMSDLSAAPNGVLHAADFVPEGDTIEQICVWGTYLDASAPGVPTFTGAEQYNCTGTVEDDFRVRVYDNDGGLPGTLIAESSVSEWGVYREPVRGTRFESLYGIELQEYTLLLDTPLVGLTPDERHWLEVANDTSEPQGNTCNWHWAVTADAGNGYCAGGTGDGYIAGGGQSVDLAFCLGEWGPLDFLPPDPPLGGCCVCDCCCLDNTTLTECEDELGGAWNLTDPDCVDAEWWCVPELGDDCETDRILITDGVYSFDTTCATTDGPDTVIGEQGLFAFGRDIWFECTATSTGRLLASLCASGIQYDAAIAIYHDFENPTQCPCPGSSSAYQVGPASNEGCNGIADGGAGIISDIPVSPGECWLIRVGGTGATAESVEGGRGLLEVVCGGLTCIVSSTPEPERLPLPENPVSRKVRYLSFSAGDSGRNQAIRVRLTALPPPFGYLNGQDMWVAQPRDISESPLTEDGHPSPPPPLFTGANLQCMPHFRDWSAEGVVHVFDDEIVPSAIYTIQVIDETCELTNEADYSAPLTLTTSGWGDVVGACTTSPCSPPDGVVNVTADLVAVLDKFKGLPGAPIKARTDLCPAVPNGIVNFDDVVGVLDAFKGRPYPPPYFTLPPTCPGSRARSRSGNVTGTKPGPVLTDNRQRALEGRDRLPVKSMNVTEPTEPGPVISLVPISASGSHQVNGSEIILAGGDQTVTLELYVSNWDEDPDRGMCCEDAGSPWTCDWDSLCSVASQDCGGGLTCVYHPRLRVFQAQIDSTGYSSGQSGTLTPGGAIQDTGHSDWVFSGIPLHTIAVATAELGYAWGGTAWLPDAVEDPGLGSAKYFGTLELYVPADAGGTFTIGFNSHDQLTYINDISGGLRIPELTTTPALITVPTGLSPPGPEDSGWGDCVDDGDCPPNIPCVGGTCYVTKNRYISFVPGNPGKQTALRVTLAELPENFNEFTGLKMWVDQPVPISENSGKISHQDGWPDLMSANLECPPDRHCMDWSTVGLLHVTDDEIVPEAVYHVQAIDCAADPQDEGNYSAPLVIPTGKWGDVCGKKGEDGKWFPPDGEVIIPHDVTAVLDKFKNLDDVLIKARSDVEPNIPEWKVNIVSDVSFVLDAFRGCPYPARAVDAPPGCPVWAEGPTGCP